MPWTTPSVPALFVDTGAFYAVADDDDVHHVEAKAVFLDRGRNGGLCTSDHVFVETWCLLRARLGKVAAMRFWDAMGSGVVRVLGVQSSNLVRAREIAHEWPDQDFSLVDCTSFALMEAHGISDAFAFDAHFRLFRFGRSRQRSLRVVP